MLLFVHGVSARVLDVIMHSARRSAWSGIWGGSTVRSLRRRLNRTESTLLDTQAGFGLPDLAGSGLETGEGSRDAIRRVEERIAGRPREHWLALATERNLPVSADHDLDSAASELPARFLERAPTQGGAGLSVPGPFLPSLGRSPSRPAPRLGEHTESVLREFGVESSGVA